VPETTIRVVNPVVVDVVDVARDLANAPEVASIHPELSDVVSVRLAEGISIIGSLSHLTEFAGTMLARLNRITEARRVEPFDQALPLGDDAVTTDGPE
jgi:hypothetical protein